MDRPGYGLGRRSGLGVGASLAGGGILLARPRTRDRAERTLYRPQPSRLAATPSTQVPGPPEVFRESRGARDSASGIDLLRRVGTLMDHAGLLPSFRRRIRESGVAAWRRHRWFFEWSGRHSRAGETAVPSPSFARASPGRGCLWE